MNIFKSLLVSIIFLTGTAKAFQVIRGNINDVYSISERGYTGMNYRLYEDDENKWSVSFNDDGHPSNREYIKEYFNAAVKGVEEEVTTVITLDFQPPLDCKGEYFYVLNKETQLTKDNRNDGKFTIGIPLNNLLRHSGPSILDEPSNIEDLWRHSRNAENLIVYFDVDDSQYNPRGIEEYTASLCL